MEGGGGESCKPPPCVQPVQPATAPSGPQDGAAQPFVGAGRRATHAQTSPHPKHPWVPPRTGSPPPNPPLALPLHPTASGLAGNACPKLSAEQSRGQSAAPHPQSRRRPPPTSPHLAVGRSLPLPGLGGGHGPHGARRCCSPKAESTAAGQEPPRPAVPKLGVEPEVHSGRDWAALGCTGLHWAALGGVRWTGRGIQRGRLEVVVVVVVVVEVGGGIADVVEDQRVVWGGPPLSPTFGLRWGRWEEWDGGAAGCPQLKHGAVWGLGGVKDPHQRSHPQPHSSPPTAPPARTAPPGCGRLAALHPNPNPHPAPHFPCWGGGWRRGCSPC